MSILKSLFGIREIKNTVFYKDFREDNLQLRELIELSKRVKSNKKKLIDRDILLLKAGISGEKNVYYELKNSFIPMICLHDLRIEEDGYVAQLDFVVITNKYIMILETKKLNGDILINESGDFIRSIKNNYGKVVKKEGIYSPIAQNDRHVRILENMLIKNKIIKKCPVISGVVIANPKSIVNKSKATRKIKEEIFRYDQVTEILNKRLKVDNKFIMLDNTIINIAEFLISSNTNVVIDYNRKYSLIDEDFIENNEDIEIRGNEYNLSNGNRESKIKANKYEGELYKSEDLSKVEYEKIKIVKEKKIEELVREITKKDNKYEVANKEDISLKSVDNLIKKLKEYRTNMARVEKVSPYFIYNNATLEEIIKLNPKNKKELIKIRGFGPVKVEKYGDSIIDIMNG